MTTTTSTLMKMVLPVPSSEPGPAWASELVQAIGTIIDQHDHTPGKGAQLPTPAFAFTADLSLGGYGLSNVSYLQLTVGAPPAGVSGLYTDGLDLYFNDDAGHVIKITASAGLNLTANRGINGQYASDVANPSLFYTTATKRYTFTTNGAALAKVRTGALEVGYLLIAANTAIGDLDGNHTLGVNTAANVQVTLPLAANNPGRQIAVKDATGGAAIHNITVVRTSTDTIDGGTTQIINTNRGVLRFVSDGVSQWLIV